MLSVFSLRVLLLRFLLHVWHMWLLLRSLLMGCLALFMFSLLLFSFGLSRVLLVLPLDTFLFVAFLCRGLLAVCVFADSCVVSIVAFGALGIVGALATFVTFVVGVGFDEFVRFSGVVGFVDVAVFVCVCLSCFV